MSLGDREAAARHIRAERASKARRLAVLASFDARLVESCLVVSAEQSKYPLEPWFGPFNQFEEIILAPDSELWRMRPDAVWVALRSEDLERDLPADYYRLGGTEARRRLAALRERVVKISEAIRRRSPATILASNFCYPEVLADHFGANNPDSLKHIINEENRALVTQLNAIPDAWVFDYERVVAFCGAASWEDPKTYYLGRVGVSAAGLVALATALVRTLAAVRRPAAKCLVLDLDDTLWRGAVGDDGLEGIQIGQDYPGNVYRDFQVRLRGLRDRGFLLAIASKNDGDVVRQVLDQHPEMILRTKDFAAIQANWGPKPRSLERIAATLNIGLDSMVFIDNDAVERAKVRAELPMVTVPEMPADITQWPGFLQTIEALDRPKLTSEDAGRADFYRAEASRKQVEAVATSPEEFLVSLELKAVAGLCSEKTIERIHQLIQKTNQFNLTTRRHSREEILRKAAARDSRVAWLRLRDRYGDQGMVCVGIIQRVADGIWEIDTFVMSCRVMGRRVETAFLSHLACLAKACGAEVLRGVHIKTPKNGPVSDFYPEHGFVAEEQPNEGAARYVMRLAGNVVEWPAAIAQEVEKNDDK